MYVHACACKLRISFREAGCARRWSLQKERKEGSYPRNEVYLQISERSIYSFLAIRLEMSIFFFFFCV